MKPALYAKQFSRDFTLAIIEIWARAETTNAKGWTRKYQPFLPYIVFARRHGIIEGYYDPQGIAWLKRELIQEVKRDEAYLSRLEAAFKEKFGRVREMYAVHTMLSQRELRSFLPELEDAWSWFEGAWWLWEMEEFERDGIEIPDSLRQLRVSTQDAAPKSDALIRSSLKKLYPELQDSIEVLRTSEIQSGNLPKRSELERRMKGFVLVQDALFVGAELPEIEKRYSIAFETIQADASISDFRGSVAHKGVVRGNVKILFSSKENGKVEDGDILVAPMTMPDFLPAMRKAAAFITDEGGIACHAAIMARELRKPCIIGTKIATTVLKDGDMVEVDANGGIVHIVERRT